MYVEKDESDMLFVRSEYLTRCEWCGTPYSLEWVGMQSGRMFCSSECHSAANAEGAQMLGVFVIVGGVLVSLVYIPFLTFYGLMFVLLGIGFLVKAREGRSYADRKDKYRNTQLLVCEYCNHVNIPGVVECENCGASLVGSEFASDPWPEWFALPPKLRKKPGRCRNCGESYEYPILSADGKHRCPRCAKPVR